MTKQKRKVNYQTEEQKEVVYFLAVLAVVVVLIGIVYFLSKTFVMDQSLFEVNYNPGTVDYERAIVGTVFNRPEKEYYVMAYHEKDEKAVYYSTLSSLYSKEEKALKVYHVDLDNDLNADAYISEGESNPKAKKVSDLKLKDLTLMRIKDGKIVKYLEKIEDIEKELAVKK